jgi:hypothetical protein
MAADKETHIIFFKIITPTGVTDCQGGHGASGPPYIQYESIKMSEASCRFKALKFI